MLHARRAVRWCRRPGLSRFVWQHVANFARDFTLRCAILLLLPLMPYLPAIAAWAVADDAAGLFAQCLAVRVALSDERQAYYAQQLNQALAAAGVTAMPLQYIVLVDRSPLAQVALLYLGNPSGGWRFLVAVPVSTGKPGRFDHFFTPTGVFVHALNNMDFRAEGTKNSFGVRGYGAKGMRVYDFGWVSSRRGWGKRDLGTMRLQMHATDPDVLERRLGQADSKGCVRIPADFNRLIDHYGLLDADYNDALHDGRHLWVLAADREPVATPGRYLVVIDTQAP